MSIIKTNKDVAVRLLVFTLFAIVIGFGITIIYLLQKPNTSSISESYRNNVVQTEIAAV